MSSELLPPESNRNGVRKPFVVCVILKCGLPPSHPFLYPSPLAFPHTWCDAWILRHAQVLSCSEMPEHPRIIWSRREEGN